MRDDSMLVVGFYLYGFANFQDMYNDENMQVTLRHFGLKFLGKKKKLNLF